MKKLILLTAVLLGFIGTQAQNPFAEYGYEPKIATLSQGQFIETFDNDTIVQIGSVLYNTKSKQIVAFVQTDTMYSEATLQPDIVSRWMSPDPLADHPTQIGLSPYHFAGNNPIYWNDPDGRCPWCLVYIAFEVGMAIYDAYDAYQTVKDPNLSTTQKAGIITASAASSIVLPGGGYGTAAKQTVKTVDKVMDANKVMSKVDEAVDIAKVTFKKEADGSWSKKSYRENLQKATGKSAEGFDAHHTLPKADEFAEFFKKADIDVNDPKNLIWREQKSHRGTSSTTHSDLWRDFMKKNPNADKGAILKQKDLIEKKVWGNTTGDVPTN